MPRLWNKGRGPISSRLLVLVQHLSLWAGSSRGRRSPSLKTSQHPWHCPVGTMHVLLVLGPRKTAQGQPAWFWPLGDPANRKASDWSLSSRPPEGHRPPAPVYASHREAADRHVRYRAVTRAPAQCHEPARPAIQPQEGVVHSGGYVPTEPLEFC